MVCQAPFAPTFTGMAVTALLEEMINSLVDVEFTAAMEQTLDSIAEGQDPLAYLDKFYKTQLLTSVANGVELDANLQVQVEGRNLVPLLEKPQSEWSDRVFVTHVGRWNIKSTEPEKFGNGPGQCSIRNNRYCMVYGKENWQLYDLQPDPGQENDVAAQHPDIVRELSAEYDQWWEDVQPHLVNEDAHKTAPKVNPFKEQFLKQFGAEPDEDNDGSR